MDLTPRAYWLMGSNAHPRICNIRRDNPELEAIDAKRVGVHRGGRKRDPELRRRVLGLIWMLTFGSMQWRIAGFLSSIPFTTLHSAFARWTRLGLWRQRLLWTAARYGQRRPAGRAALMAANSSKASS